MIIRDGWYGRPTEYTTTAAVAAKDVSTRRVTCRCVRPRFGPRGYLGMLAYHLRIHTHIHS